MVLCCEGMVEWVLPAAAAAGLLLLLLTAFGGDPVRRERTFAAGLLLLFFAAGSLAALLSRRTVRQHRACDGPAVVAATVLIRDTTRSGTVRLRVWVDALRHDGRWCRPHGEAVLYLAGVPPAAAPAAGEHLLARAVLRPFTYRGHPGEFNYRRYMEDHGCYWQGQVEEGGWYAVAGRGGTLRVRAARVRAAVAARLQRLGFGGREEALLAALLAGDRSRLDLRTRDLFAGSGTMHVLAISGLHTGILFMVLMWLFSFFRPTPLLLLVRGAAGLVLLWGYAFLTGLAPSVTRAALMFSLFLAAATLRRRTQPLNTLTAAAFLMLAVHPVLLRDTAFQLSFLAVLGILLIYLPLRQQVLTGRPLPDAVISLFLISVSAQMMTFPLTLYYFHRFSFLSPFVNVLVVPLVTLILYAGIALFLLSWTPAVVVPVTLLHVLTQALLWVVGHAAALSRLRLDGVWLTPWQVIMAYLLLAAFLLWAWRPRPRRLIAAQALLLAGLLLTTVTTMKRTHTCSLLVCDTPGASTFLLRSGDRGILLAEEEEGHGAHCAGHAAAALGMKEVIRMPPACLWDTSARPAHDGAFFLGRGFFRAGTLTGYLLTDTTCTRYADTVAVDVMIFSGRRWWLVPRQLITVRPSVLVLDAAVPPWVARRLRDTLNDLPVVAVREQGPWLSTAPLIKRAKSFPLLGNFYTFAPYSSCPKVSEEGLTVQ